MAQKDTPDVEVTDRLKTLGIVSRCQWDLLIFLYRHQTSLFGADYLARLSGYATESVVAALDALESLKLVGRSRVSQGARFYQFIMPSSPPGGEAFAWLLALTSHRAGRLRLSRQLSRENHRHLQGLQASRRFLAEAKRAVQQRAQKDEGRKRAWLKVI
jgi:DNA-binding MarR family transcriptional regulator